MACQANHEATRVQQRQDEDQPCVDKGTTNFTRNPPTALTWAVPETRGVSCGLHNLVHVPDALAPPRVRSPVWPLPFH